MRDTTNRPPGEQRFRLRLRLRLLSLPLVRSLQERVQSDFRIAIYVAFGVMAWAVLVPVATIRLLQGRWFLGLFEFAFALVILIAVSLAWRGHDINRLSVFVAMVVAAAGWAFTLLSPAGIFWQFPFLMAVAFIAPFWLTVVLLVTTTAMLWSTHSDAPSTGGSIAMVLLALAVNTIFVAVFARQSGQSRGHLEVLVNRDPLTGAGNRRALESALEEAMVQGRQSPLPMTLVLLDLDHFKSINDNHGHEEGDDVLRRFAALVQNLMRSSDQLFRFGGEEFVLLMRGGDHRAVQRVFGQLQERMTEALTIAGNPITVSAGSAQLSSGDDIKRWIARADEALYRAKETGRNRLVLAVS